MHTCPTCNAKAKKPGHNATHYDPSKTAHISKAWLKDIDRRWYQLRKDVHKELLMIHAGPRTNASGPYQFKTDPHKLEHFKDWLQKKVGSKVLEVSSAEPMSVYKGQWWAGKYIQSAYKRGMLRSIEELRASKSDKASKLLPSNVSPASPEAGRHIGVSFLAPIHADRVALLYGRAFEGMKGINDDVSNRLSGLLAEGMASGVNPVDTGRLIDKALDIGKARANTIARTETIRAHHIGSINTYRQAGVEGVRVLAELLTVAGEGGDFDAMHVCEDCAELQEQTMKEPMSLDDIESLIPVHPNCRCVAIPVVHGPDGENLSEGDNEGETDAADEDTAVVEDVESAGNAPEADPNADLESDPDTVE